MQFWLRLKVSKGLMDRDGGRSKKCALVCGVSGQDVRAARHRPRAGSAAATVGKSKHVMLPLTQNQVRRLDGAGLGGGIVLGVLDALEGSMEGTYLMQRQGGEYFRAEIPRFTLRAGAN